MKKKVIENKVVMPSEDKTLPGFEETVKDDRILIEILPLRGIGGIGGPGNRALLPKAQAEQYIREGYAKKVKE